MDTGADMMTLKGESKMFKHGKAHTLYVAIPSAVAQDSAFPIKEGDRVRIEYIPEKNEIQIRKIGR